LSRRSSIKSRGVVFGAALVCVFCSGALAQPWDGNGVEGDPYQIWTPEDMQAIGADANYWDAHFILCADIDLGGYTGTSFNIIGTDGDNPFTGVFDGNGHTISNFTYSTTGTNYIGLFGCARSSEWEVDFIKDLCLIEPDVNAVGGYFVGFLIGVLSGGKITGCCVQGGDVSGDYYVGGLAGYASSVISGCYSNGGVSGSMYVGGLVGYDDCSIISDCNSGSTVYGNDYTGGLAGAAYGGWGKYDYYAPEFHNCYATGDVNGYDYTGGLVGYVRGGIISNCYTVGSVTGKIDDSGHIGGLVGAARSDDSFIVTKSIISECYSKGIVTGENHVGGLVGSSSGCTISKCYSESNVSGEGAVGGLVGESDGDVINSYAAGFVSGRDFIGGLMGGNGGDISHCYSTGSITALSVAGGLIGYDDGSGDYASCFWDVNVNPDMNGIGNGTDPNVIGKTTEQMQAAVTFMDWSCDSVWTINESVDYPRLWWQNLPGELITGSYWYAGGSGEPNDPFLIETAEQLNVVGALSCDWDKHFKLVADIDLAGFGPNAFKIIGKYVGHLDPGNKPFIGVFDGDGHTISSFTYISSGAKRVGFFSYTENATIKDLGFVDAYVSAAMAQEVGVMVGFVEGGSVLGCYVDGGSVYSEEYDAGGLIGQNHGGIVANCYSSASASGEVIGGLAGRVTGGQGGWPTPEITNCYSVGIVTGGLTGGLVGSDYGGVYTSCFWDVNVNPDVDGIGDGSDPNVIGKTTAEMQMESTFTDAGWDFVGEVINGTEDIWEICEGTNYPKFVWQIPEADFVCPDGVNFIDYGFFADHWLETDYGDVNGVELSGDGKVNWEDFGLFAEWWMVSGCGGCGGADFTGEGDVDYLDLDVFAGYWLESEYGDCGGAELTGDGAVGLDDLGRFSVSWLAGL